MSIAAGTRLGRYEILAPIGAGGMGEVYLAEDTQLGRRAALKLLRAQFTKDPERVRRFAQEARAASALNHPNIITIYEIGQAAGTHFIATEFVEGKSLRHHLGRSGMKLREVLEVSTQIASALAAAHAAGIVHRDIKPENLMLRPDGYVKVLDFGLAKLIERPPLKTDTEAPTIAMVETDPGVVMGTAHYMSPEQALGLEVDARSDIFSLGVVIYELFVGRAPFKGTTTSHVIVSVLECEPPPLQHHAPEAPAELERIVSKALAKDREERYQTIKDLLIDLRRLKSRLEAEAELGRSTLLDLRSETTGGAGSDQKLIERAKKPASAPRQARPWRRRLLRKPIDSLAILPLENASADREVEYLCDGITETIINSLAQLPRLRVMARSTVFRYKGREGDAQEVGRELGVRAVLTGRMLQLGDRLVIKVELVDVADGAQLWGEEYHRQPADILAVQAEIAKEISEKLRLRLTGEEKQRLVKRYTENTEAYQLYLKGRYYWNRRTVEGARRGIEYFNQAIEIDPNYALAYAGLADCYALLGSAVYGAVSPREAMPKAKAAALKALEVDDTLAEAQASLAAARAFFDWDWAGAEASFQRALELNPGYATAHQWYALYLTILERFDEAMAEIKRAQEFNPLSLIINTSVGRVCYYAREYDRAIEQYRKTLEMDPNFLAAQRELGMAYEQKGMYEEAVAAFERALRLVEGDTHTIALLGHAYAGSGRREAAQQILGQLKELSQQRYVSPYSIALLHTGLGEREQAFAWLEKAYADRSDWLGWLKVNPRLDSLRADARFQDLLRRVGLQP